MDKILIARDDKTNDDAIIDKITIVEIDTDNTLIIFMRIFIFFQYVAFPYSLAKFLVFLSFTFLYVLKIYIKNS